MSNERPTKMKDRYEPGELLYSATARCKCGHGLAYPNGHDAFVRSSWMCGAVLRGDVEPTDDQLGAHEEYPFAFYDIKAEGQPSRHGASTRPPEDGVLWWEPKCTCKCGHTWTTERRLPSAPDPWAVGPCPACGTPSRNENGSSNLDIDVRANSVLVPPDE